ncbi:hypothetical protein D9M68_686810 [compost metagenome]
MGTKPPCARFEEAGVFEEDDPVAGGKLAKSSCRLELPRSCQGALVDHDLAQRLVQLPNIIVGVGENKQFVAALTSRVFARGRFLKQVTAGIGPIGNDAVDDLGPGFGLDDAALLGISIEALFDLAAGEETRRIARPRFALAAHPGKFRKADPFGDCPERRARLDRLKLHRVTNEHDLRPYLLDRLEDARHLLRGDHAGLVDHQHIATAELLTPSGPS